MIIQSWIDKSLCCCSLTHSRTTVCLRVIWSQGQSQLNSHCDPLKYKKGAKQVIGSLVIFVSLKLKEHRRKM